MSNTTLRNRIVAVLESYRIGDANLLELRDAVVSNGRALEMMPYDLVKEIDKIEYLLTLAQFDDDSFEPQLGKAFLHLDRWLDAIPLENQSD